MIVFLIRPVLLIFLLLLTACSQEEGDKSSNRNSSDGFSESTVKLTSLVSAEQQKSGSEINTSATTSQFDCTTVSDIYQNEGSCISPVQAKGSMSSIDFGLVRIAGPSEFATEGDLLSSVEFDLFNPFTIVTNNTLRNAYDLRNTYASLSLNTAYYQIKFPLTYNNGTTKWVTLFLAQYGQPFSESVAVKNAIDQCELTDEASKRSNFTQMDFVDGLTFSRGDYLYCVKDSELDICASNDFMWLDQASNNLVSTRPSNPKQAHALVNEAITCSMDDGRIGFDFGNFALYANIEPQNRFKLWADFSHGEVSRQWSDTGGFPVGDTDLIPPNSESWISPYYIYSVQNCPNGICSQTIQGSNLDVEFIFDTHGMIFVEDMDESLLNAETEIGNILSLLSTKSQWAFDQRSKANIIGFDVEDIGGIDVKAIISVSRAINNPPEKAIINCPGDDRC